VGNILITKLNVELLVDIFRRVKPIIASNSNQASHAIQVEVCESVFP
jgi:hypothetical protein